MSTNQVLPAGAEELLIAMQTPTPRGLIGIPALLWGQPGEGKTSFVEAFHRPEFPVVTLIASIHDPTDFSGLPVFERGRMHFAAPDWSFAFEEQHGGVLFLDELTTAPPSVQAALLRVVLERKVGGKSLPAGVRIIAAANPPDEVAGGWELSPPLANRFVHLSWNLSGVEFATALEEGFAGPALPAIDVARHREAVQHWKMMTAAFLRRDPAAVRTKPADGEIAFASPRTWDYAIALMATCDLLDKAAKPGGRGSTVFYNLLVGCLGSGAAKSYVAFLKDLKLPNPEKVLDGKENVVVGSLTDDELYVFFCALAAALLKRGTKKSESELLDGVLVVLRLAHEVDRAGKVDTIFAPLRQMVRGQMLQQAVVAAHSARRLKELQAALTLVFENTPLADYISLLDAPREAAS